MRLAETTDKYHKKKHFRDDMSRRAGDHFGIN